MKIITAEDLANTKIRVTPEQSKKVQELAFSLGYDWWNGNKEAKHTDKTALFFGSDNEIEWDNEGWFKAEEDHKPITYADLFPEEPELLSENGIV
jgi:hypothetical protein